MNNQHTYNFPFKNVPSIILIILICSLLFFLIQFFLSSQYPNISIIKGLCNFLQLLSVALLTSGIVGIIADFATRIAIRNYFTESLLTASKEKEELNKLGIEKIYENRWKSIEIQKNIIDNATSMIYCSGTTMSSFVGAGLHLSFEQKLNSTNVSIHVAFPDPENQSVKFRRILEDYEKEDTDIDNRVTIARKNFYKLLKFNNFKLFLFKDIAPYYYLIGNERELLVAPYGYDIGGKYPVFHLINNGDKSLYNLYWNDIQVLFKIGNEVKKEL